MHSDVRLWYLEHCAWRLHDGNGHLSRRRHKKEMRVSLLWLTARGLPLLVQGLEPQEWTLWLFPRVEGGIIGIEAGIIPTSSLQLPGRAFHHVKQRNKRDGRQLPIATVKASVCCASMPSPRCRFCFYVQNPDMLPGCIAVFGIGPRAGIWAQGSGRSL